MLYLPDVKALFLHVPRTGGTSVEEYLKRSDITISGAFRRKRRRIVKKHALYHHYKPEYLAKADFVFAYVRHPVSYYESTWKWLRDLGPKKRSWILTRYEWHPFMSPVRHWRWDFNRWARHMVAEDPGWCTRLYESYVGQEGAEICNFVGRTEHLVDDFVNVLEVLGYDRVRRRVRGLDMRHNSRSKRVAWDGEVRCLVESVEKPSIKRWYQEGGNGR